MDCTFTISTESTRISRHELNSPWWLEPAYAEGMENDENMRWRGHGEDESKCGHTHTYLLDSWADITPAEEHLY